MNLSSFIKEKTSKSNFPAKKKKKVEVSDVVIQIGIKRIVDGILKTKWGKRLPVSVPKNATYNDITDRALKKWSAFDRNFDSTEPYVIVFDDGRIAVNLPGSVERFQLHLYKEALGKDYKRITLYLCSEADIKIANESYEDSSDSSESFSNFNDIQPDSLYYYTSESTSNLLTSSPTSNLLTSPPTSDLLTSPPTSNLSTSPQITEDLLFTIDSAEEIVAFLNSALDRSKQFFIAVRRGVDLNRILRVWQNTAKTVSPKFILSVKYQGEMGIDQGALTREFLSTVIGLIGNELFYNGIPICSTLHMQNGYFRTAGEICAVSIAMGGRLPIFLEECAYKLLFKELDLLEISDSDLSPSEMKVPLLVKEDCVAYSNLILENDYTGKIDQNQVEEIIKSLKVSFVSKRSLYMKEFLKGLGLLGLSDMISRNPGLCREFFVKKQEPKVDSNYLFSILCVSYSDKGSSKICLEERIIDFFQDFLISIENNQCEGLNTAITWDNDDPNEAVTEITPEMSVKGILGWLTGQQHYSDDLLITVKFEHDCLIKNPNHTICFPIVSACSMEIVLPVVHMDTESKFREVFVLAYCKGYAFGRH